MKFSYIALDLISALYLIVMLVGAFQTPKDAVSKTRPFRISLFMCLIGCFTEAGSNYCDGDLRMTDPLIAYNAASILLVDLVVFFYCLYLYGLLRMKGIGHRIFLGILSGLSIVSMLLNAYMSYTGHMFTIENGVFTPGDFYNYRNAISSVVFVCIFLIFVIWHEVFGIRSIWLTFLFMLIPSASTFISRFFVEETRHSVFPVTALSLFVVYVVIQSRIIIDTDVSAQLFSKMSVCDALTGVKNRRGYDDLINAMTEGENVSVIFCDANGLKTVNDNSGHAAGDAFIQKIAKMLCDAFPDGDVCRISGDEFVCVLKNAEEEKFIKRMDAFKKSIKKEDRILAFGYAQGDGAQFLGLVKEAEKMMYKDKESYYRETGKDRRK